MNDDISYTLLQTTLTVLRSMQFTAFEGDGIPSITDNLNQIKGGKIRREKDEYRGFENLVTPGLFLTPGNQEWPPDRGVNNADDGFYTAMILLIAQDNQARDLGARTFYKWLGMVRRKFNNNWQAWNVNDERGEVLICQARTINTFDERYPIQHKKMVGAVELRWHTREPQGPQSDEE